MKKPIPKNFGIQPEDITLAENVKVFLILASLICMIAGLVYAYGLNSCWWLILLMPPHGPFIIYLSLKTLLRGLWPAFDGALNYKSALEAYDIWWQRTQTQFWTSLSGLQFEHELAALFCRTGTKAHVTSASDDKGVDIWLEKGGRKIPVQCKAHKNRIGPAAARELLGTMLHFGADEGILASLSGFTRGVHEYVQGKPIRLLALADIIQMQKKYGNSDVFHAGAISPHKPFYPTSSLFRILACIQSHSPPHINIPHP